MWSAYPHAVTTCVPTYVGIHPTQEMLATTQWNNIMIRFVGINISELLAFI